jgi:hypothetical protein
MEAWAETQKDICSCDYNIRKVGKEVRRERVDSIHLANDKLQ